MAITTLDRCPICDHVTEAGWDEDQHPRDKDGKFAPAGGGGGYEPKSHEFTGADRELWTPDHLRGKGEKVPPADRGLTGADRELWNPKDGMAQLSPPDKAWYDDLKKDLTDPDRIAKPKAKGGGLSDPEWEAHVRTELPKADLGGISAMIRADHAKSNQQINYALRPYLDALSSLSTMNDMYGADSAGYVVSYLLANAGKWKGPTAKLIKAELKRRLSGK